MAVGERIVDMDKAAFGAFNMVKSEGVRHAAEFETIWVVERTCVEGNNAIPTALHRYRMA